jgi:hypothetical protein
MNPLDLWLTSVWMIVIGTACIWLCLTFFAEYRKAFMADPVSVMTLEVLLAVLRCGPAGYAAIIVMYGGILLAAAGLTMLLFAFASDADYVWQALKQTLGLQSP